MGAGFWYLKQCRLLERLTDDELRRLEARSRVRRFRRNSPVYLPSESSDSVFLLTSGRVKICHLTPEGKQSILAFIEPGEMFGELALVEPGEAREEYAETVEPSDIVWMPGETVRELAEQNAGLSLSITRLIGMRRRRIERRLRHLLFLSNKQRLCHLLLELAEQYGKRDQEGVTLSIRLSHQDLAAVIGATRETVTVILGELQSAEILKVGRRRITVTNIDKLAGVVDEPAPSVKSSQPEAPPGLERR